jgi:hypothetical protein
MRKESIDLVNKPSTTNSVFRATLNQIPQKKYKWAWQSLDLFNWLNYFVLKAKMYSTQSSVPSH